MAELCKLILDSVAAVIIAVVSDNFVENFQGDLSDLEFQSLVVLKSHFWQDVFRPLCYRLISPNQDLILLNKCIAPEWL